MQDKRIKPETIPRGNPAVTPLAADKSARKPQTFECCTIDHSDNSPSMRSTGFPDVFLLHIGTSWNMVEKPVSTRFQRGFGKRKERRKELHEEVLFESSKKLILMQVRKKGAPRGNYHFECDLFDLLSNAPYEIVRHRPRASSGRMRDFGARTAIFRRGARPRKARRCGIHCGQTGQWVTPFRVRPLRPLE